MTGKYCCHHVKCRTFVFRGGIETGQIKTSVFHWWKNQNIFSASCRVIV